MESMRVYGSANGEATALELRGSQWEAALHAEPLEGRFEIQLTVEAGDGFNGSYGGTLFANVAGLVDITLAEEDIEFRLKARYG